MKNGDWEIVVWEDVHAWMVRVCLVFRNPTGPAQIAHINKNGQIELSDIIAGKQTDPTFELNRDVWEALKHSLLDVKERDKSTVEGELTATKYHLEDLRYMLKIHDRIIIKKQED